MDAVLSYARPDATLAVTRGAARLLASLNFTPVLEAPLPNGRRADLMALGPRGEIAIIEVKSGPADYLADRKWGDYRPYCDLFYFAVPPEFPLTLLPEEPGLIVADSFGGAVVREAMEAPLAAARRKALVLGLARLASMRAISSLCAG